MKILSYHIVIVSTLYYNIKEKANIIACRYKGKRVAIFNIYSPKWRWIVVDIYRAATFTDTEVNNCFSIYLTSWITSGPKSNFICDNTSTKTILFFVGCSEVNSTWLIISELASQRAGKVLFTCVVYTKLNYNIASIAAQSNSVYVSVLKISIVYADRTDRASKLFFSASGHCQRGEKYYISRQ